MHEIGRIACGAAGAGVIAVACWVAAAGCTAHPCDASVSHFDGGRMVDENTYETNAFDEPWIPFPGNVTLNVAFPPDVLGRVQNRKPSLIVPYVGATEQPNVPPNSNFSGAFGQLAELSSLENTGFSALNATCATYFARFVVLFPAVDGGTDAQFGAGSGDAGADVGTH